VSGNKETPPSPLDMVRVSLVTSPDNRPLVYSFRPVLCQSTRRGSAMQKLIMACKDKMSWEDFEELKRDVPGTVRSIPRTSGRKRLR